MRIFFDKYLKSKPEIRKTYTTNSHAYLQQKRSHLQLRQVHPQDNPSMREQNLLCSKCSAWHTCISDFLLNNSYIASGKPQGKKYKTIYKLSVLKITPNKDKMFL